MSRSILFSILLSMFAACVETSSAVDAGAAARYLDACRDIERELCRLGGACGFAKTSQCSLVDMGLRPCIVPSEVLAGRQTVDEVELAELRKALKKSTCLSAIVFLNLSVPLQGRGQLNEPCNARQDCASGLRCDEATCPGMCLAKRAVGEATTTPNSKDECASSHATREGVCDVSLKPGSTCSLSRGKCLCVAGVCTLDLLTPVGGVCSGSNMCQLGSSCQNNTCEKGTKSDVGSRCSDERDCLPSLVCRSGFCRFNPSSAKGSVCEGPGTRGTCDRFLTCNGVLSNGTGYCSEYLLRIGDECFYGSRAFCGGETFCTATAENPNGRCVALRSAGDLCPAGIGCQKNLLCINSTCVAPLVPGALCTSSECGSAAFCPPGNPRVCIAKKTAGSQCQEDMECLGSCFNNQCYGCGRSP
jgi:hypothetical protein